MTPRSPTESQVPGGSVISNSVDRPPRAAPPPNFRKRIHLSHPNEGAHSKRPKITHKPQPPVHAPLRLTAHNLSKLDKPCDYGGPSFEDESTSRAMQTAGEKLGFSLRLECYMPPATSIKHWCEARDIWFEERPILKAPQDLADMDLIAKSFVVPRAAVTGVAC